MQKLRTPLILLSIIVFIVGVILFFKWDIEVSSVKKYKVAIQGYDTVSYFTNAKAEMGTTQWEYFWNKLLWRFSSKEHLNLFKNDPAKYAPQFGGNCSFTTSLGKEQMGLGKHWLIVNEKLYLNSNIVSHLIWKFFPSLIHEAEVQWVELIKEKEAYEALHPELNSALEEE